MVRNQYKRVVLTAGAFMAIIVLGSTLFNALFTSSFSFTNLQEEQRLSGDVNIAISVRGTIHFIELWIDGRKYSAQNTGASGSNQYATFGIPTSGFTNGSHTLELRLGHTVYDRRDVVFQNAKHPG